MTTIRVENFQSIGLTEIEATGLTVVTGPSDRGKSALLRAIEGALFNRAGDQFVRRGAKQATVTVQLPDAEITWEKGSGVNRFTLSAMDPAADDVVYAKVGTKAPDALQALGFREVTIGARVKDDGKQEGGEILRPQVSHQFGSDQVFLLDRPGTFINELLVKISRLGVLQRAGRQCTLDLKQQRSLVKVRREDLTTAALLQDQLAPIVGLAERVAALQQRRGAVRLAVQQMNTLRNLLVNRRRYAAVVALPLPAPGARLTPMGEKIATLRQLVPQRQRWAAIPALPPVRSWKKSTVQAIEQWDTLRPTLIDRRQQVNWVDQAEAIAVRCDNAATALKSEMARMRLDLIVCPTCDRAF